MNSHLLAASWGRESTPLLKQLSVRIPGMRLSPGDVGVRYLVTSASIGASAAAWYLERVAASFATFASFSKALDAATVAAVALGIGDSRIVEIPERHMILRHVGDPPVGTPLRGVEPGCFLPRPQVAHGGEQGAPDLCPTPGAGVAMALVGVMSD